MNSIRYVALLRGINVGGKMVRMEKLRTMFASLGYTNIKTLLNSGNVLFESNEKNTTKLLLAIESNLTKTFGFEILTILRTVNEIQEIVDEQPFKNIPVTPLTRLYVTFLTDKHHDMLRIPNESEGKDFTILRVSKDTVFSIATLSPQKGTTDAMVILEKEFGKKITTRNWNTVVKIAGNTS